MVMTKRENFLRTVEFRRPEWIPCEVEFMYTTWRKYKEKLEKIILKHPTIFREYVK